MCDALGIEPKPNNGTLRLPLKPIGLHSDKPTSSEEDHPDLPAKTSHTEISPTGASESKSTDSPDETNAQDDGTPLSETKPAAPVETDIPNETAPPEGNLL